MSTRKRKTDHGITDFDALMRAIKDVKIEKKSIRATARAYDIPKSSLARYITKLDKEISDISTIDDNELLKIVCKHASYATPSLVFSSEEEDALVGYLQKCSGHYYGLSITELKQLAYQFAKKVDVDYPSSWDADEMAGKNWYYSFMQRHPHLSLRTPEQTSLNRVKAFCKENVDHFFANLDKVLVMHPFDASAIWNMDETGFSTVPSKVGKVIAMKGVKRVGQIASAERGTMITMALAVNAEGNFMPPFFLFPRKNMQSSFMDNASPGAVGYANGSGWMQQPEFVKFMHHFIQRSKSSVESPTLLLIDNHSSHLSIEALDMAAENGVTLLSFPPHCTHRLQPLDVSVYGVVKNYYKSQCNAWLRNNVGKVLEIRNIPGLVRSALDLALTPRNIKAGFQVTGISPYNPDVFVDSDFVKVPINDENETAILIEQAEVDKENHRPLSISSDLSEAAGHVKVSDPKEPTTSMSRASSLSSVLTAIGPLQEATPAKKSKRGRKAMKSTILTSPETIAALKEKQKKPAPPKTSKKFSRKKSRPKISVSTTKRAEKHSSPSSPSSSSSEDVDFCLICLKDMPCKLNRSNSIACIECNRAVHLKCANMRGSCFICKHCDSDDE